MIAPLRFHQLESLQWLWLAAGIALLIVYGIRAKRLALHRFAVQSLWDHLLPRVSLARHYVRGGLIVGAALLMVLGLLDPRWGVRYEQVQRRGIDVLFVIDVSRSMLAEDVAPNRLERAKQYVLDIVDELAGDRAGVIAFAGVPAIKCPLTVDYGALRLSLNELAPQGAARGGSLLGDALRLAGDCFTDEARDARIVVVLSDGEDQGSYPVEAAKKLVAEHNTRVFTVGLGDATEGARIPLRTNQGRTFLTYQGQEVWSKMDPEVLRQIALEGNGAFVPAGTHAADLAELYRKKIAPLGHRDVEAGRIEIHQPRYQWFAATALAMLLIESWMSDRRSNHRRPSMPEEST
jgi:Ca-activated chloride channel family protein